MSARFGEAWDRIEHKRKGPGSHFMNKWEVVKRQFGDSGDDRVQSLGPLNLKGVEDSKWYDEDETMVLLNKSVYRWCCKVPALTAISETT